MNFASLLNTDWFSFLNKWGKWWSYLCAEVKRFLIGSCKNKRQKFPPSNTSELGTRPDPFLLCSSTAPSEWLQQEFLRIINRRPWLKTGNAKQGFCFPSALKKRCLRTKGANFLHILKQSHGQVFSCWNKAFPLTLKTLYLNAKKTRIWEYFFSFHPNISFIKYSASMQSK